MTRHLSESSTHSDLSGMYMMPFGLLVVFFGYIACANAVWLPGDEFDSDEEPVPILSANGMLTYCAKSSLSPW